MLSKRRPRSGMATLHCRSDSMRCAGKLNSPLRGHFNKDKVKPLRFLKEIRLDEAELDSYNVGQEIKADIFGPGESVDVQGISKGKGFAGAIKRHGFHRVLQNTGQNTIVAPDHWEQRVSAACLKEGSCLAGWVEIR